MTLCRPDLLCCYYSREVFQIRRPAQAVVPGYEGRHLNILLRWFCEREVTALSLESAAGASVAESTRRPFPSSQRKDADHRSS